MCLYTKRTVLADNHYNLRLYRYAALETVQPEKIAYEIFPDMDWGALATLCTPPLPLTTPGGPMCLHGVPVYLSVSCKWPHESIGNWWRILG